MKGGERGQVMVIFVIALVSLFGAASLTVDVAHGYAAKRHLQNVAAAAALAGAKALPDPVGVKQAVASYLGKNAVPDAQGTTTIQGHEVTVAVDGTAHFYFAPVIGIDSAPIHVWATAEQTPVGAVEAARPFGVPVQSFVEGKSYELGDGGLLSPGNFGALALGGRGASVYRQNIQQGYGATLIVGQTVETEPGEMRGPSQSGVDYLVNQDPSATWQTVQPGSPRLIKVPIISLPEEGRSTVTIEGFGMFFLAGWDPSTHAIQGRFVSYFSQPTRGAPGGAQNFGLDECLLVAESH